MRPLIFAPVHVSPTSEWIAFADEHNTTIAPCNSQTSLADDPQFKARMGFYPIDKLGCEQLPLPVFVNGQKPPCPTMAPEVGQHTDEVLGRVLGKSASELEKLRKSGVFG